MWPVVVTVPSLMAREGIQEEEKGLWLQRGGTQMTVIRTQCLACKVEMKACRRVREKGVLLRDLKTRSTDELALGGGHKGVGNTAQQHA